MGSILYALGYIVFADRVVGVVCFYLSWGGIAGWGRSGG